jgi:hypothetical protein
VAETLRPIRWQRAFIAAEARGVGNETARGKTFAEKEGAAGVPRVPRFHTSSLPTTTCSSVSRPSGGLQREGRGERQSLERPLKTDHLRGVNEAVTWRNRGGEHGL